jgi:hypothetical protein
MATFVAPGVRAGQIGGECYGMLLPRKPLPSHNRNHAWSDVFVVQIGAATRPLRDSSSRAPSTSCQPLEPLRIDTAYDIAVYSEEPAVWMCRDVAIGSDQSVGLAFVQE